MDCNPSTRAKVDTTQYVSLIPGLPDDLAFQCLARVSNLASLSGVSQGWEAVLGTSEEPGGLLSVRSQVTGIHCDTLSWLYTLVRKENSLFWQAFDPIRSRWHALAPIPDELKLKWAQSPIQPVSTKRKLIMFVMENAPFGKYITKSAVHGLSVTIRDRNYGMHRGRVEEPPAARTDSSLGLTPWVLDTAKQEWRKGLSLSLSTGLELSVSRVINGKILIIRMWRNANVTDVAEMDIYCPEKDVWELVYPEVNDSASLPLIFRSLNEFRIHSRKVIVGEKSFRLDPMAGVLSTCDNQEDIWRLILVDSQLKGLWNLTPTHSGKICAITNPANDDRELIQSSYITIIDVNQNPPSIFKLHVPQGTVRVVQILSRMRPNSS